MEQIVRVKEVYPDGSAQVIHVRESACSGDCHKCSGCGAAKESILLTLLPTLLMIGALVFFFILMTNQAGGGGKAMRS